MSYEEKHQKLKIYAASRTHHARMWQKVRASGRVFIVSSWIDESGPGQTADLSELWARIQREVTTADRLVLFVQAEDFPLKGALIEAGMALAAGVPVVIVLDPDVQLEERSLRPLGSWAKHPLVQFRPTVYDALEA